MRFFYIINIFGMSSIEALKYSNSIGWTSNSTMDTTNATNKRIGETFEKQLKNEKVVMDQETFNQIYWDREKIIDYLKSKCLKKRNIKKYWVEWIHYCLILPEIEWSEYKQLNWWVYAKWNGKSLSKRKFEAVSNFMKAIWVTQDENIDDFITELLNNRVHSTSESVVCHPTRAGWRSSPNTFIFSRRR